MCMMHQTTAKEPRHKLNILRFLRFNICDNMKLITIIIVFSNTAIFSRNIVVIMTMTGLPLLQGMHAVGT